MASGCPAVCPAQGVLFLSVLMSLSPQVWAVNSAGKAPSSWARCRTQPAPPEGLSAPSVHAVSSTQAVLNISVPSKPNGDISLYRLFSNTSGVLAVVSAGPRGQGEGRILVLSPSQPPLVERAAPGSSPGENMSLLETYANSVPSLFSCCGSQD